jgi:RNA 3'-terminal phosphate cyclase (ATP)
MAAPAEALLAETASMRTSIAPARRPNARAQVCSSLPNSITVLAGSAYWAAAANPPSRLPAKPSRLLGYIDSGVALDAHMGDQVLLPAVFASSSFRFAIQRVTSHLTTNDWVIEQFGCARVGIYRRDNGTASVTVDPLCRVGDGGLERR